MKTILVPTDFSVCAGNALQYAIGMAKQQNAAILLIHAFAAPYPVSDPGGFLIEQMQKEEDETNIVLKNLADKVKSESGVDCDYLIGEESGVELILDLVERKRADMVIMGTHGASGIKEKVFGSKTSQVIAHAQCPVIAVPAQAHFGQIRKILYATNFYTGDIDHLKELLPLAHASNSHIHVLHIAEELVLIEKEIMNEFIARVQKEVAYDNITFELLEGSPVAGELDEYLRKQPADLVVTSTLQRSLWERLFETSVTRALVCHTHIPLLAFQNSKDSVRLA